MAKKTELRKAFLNKRDLLSPEYISKHSIIIKNKLKALEVYNKASFILLYASYKSEVQTRPIFDDAISKGKTVYFPIVQGDNMSFIKVTDYDSLNSGYKGILEPAYDDALLYKNKPENGIIIVPGACFSNDGKRIGYGKGFYDRFLQNSSIYKIAICFDIQFSDEIEADENDIKMDMVISG